MVVVVAVRMARYHAMVAYMDSRVGMVVGALKDKGMFDDTVIFFSSDNGGPIYRTLLQYGAVY